MKNIPFKITLRFFFLNAIPFGLWMGIFFGLQHGLMTGIKSGISSGLMFGLWMTLTLLPYYWYKAKKSGKNPTMDFNPFQKSTVELDLNMDKAFEECVQALEHFGAIIKSQNKEKSEIKAATKISWNNGWGETLTIKLTDLKNGKVKIEITNSPKLNTQIIDLTCKGKENVEKLAKILATGNN